MHEDNHAEIVSSSTSFSHNRTTNSISISYGSTNGELTLINLAALLPDPEKWKKNIPISPLIPLPAFRLASGNPHITDTLQPTQYHVPYPIDSLKFNTEPG